MPMDQSRVETMSSIRKITDYDDFNLYKMDIEYDYDLNRIIDNWNGDNSTLIDAILAEAAPGLKVDIEMPEFGCTVFSSEIRGDAVMGRNYDFKLDSSAMMVRCKPKNGYRSIGFCALDNLRANDPFESDAARVSCLASPFTCLDGINEKGVSIAVLTLDSQPTKQDTGKKKISTTLAIRLILDEASSTKEAVELFKQYDMIASSGRDYHFFVSDNTGCSYSFEYDCDSRERPLVSTPSMILTNFFTIYGDMVAPNQKNGPYGHGKERYDKVMEELGKTNYSPWQALKAASVEPNPDDITSNTQWSIIFNNSVPSAEICIRRRWDDKFKFSVE